MKVRGFFQRRSTVWWAAFIFVFALSVRLLALLLLGFQAPFADAADYDRHARSIADLGVYPTTVYAAPGTDSAYRPPGYPIFLALIYKLSGNSIDAGRVTGAVLGSVSVVLLWGLSREFWSRRLALAVAAVASVLPSLVLLSSGLLAENLFVPLMLASLLSVARFVNGSRVPWLIAAAVFLGAAILTRSNGLFLIPPLLWAAWSARRRLRDPALVLVVAAVVLAPWAVRNVTSMKGFAPLGTQTGFTLAGQWNAEAMKRGYYFAAWRIPMETGQFTEIFNTGATPTLTEAQMDSKLRKRALDFAFDNPGYVLEAFGLHLLQQLDVGPSHTVVNDASYTELGVPNEVRWLIRYSTWALLIAIAASAVVATLKRRSWSFDRQALGPCWLWLAPILIYLSAAPAAGAVRYRIAVDPFLIYALVVLGAVLFSATRTRAVKAP